MMGGGGKGEEGAMGKNATGNMVYFKGYAFLANMKNVSLCNEFGRPASRVSVCVENFVVAIFSDTIINKINVKLCMMVVFTEL